MKKTMFLDIDGVIATEKEFMLSKKTFHQKHEEAKRLNIPYPFNPGCVKVLNSIIEKTDVDIVITSDWRIFWDLERMSEIFKFNGIIKPPNDFTGFHRISFGNETKNRAHEIKVYLQSHDVGSYVVLDDMHLDLYEMDRFVKTIDNEGLKQVGLKKKILNFLNTEIPV